MHQVSVAALLCCTSRHKQAYYCYPLTLRNSTQHEILPSLMRRKSSLEAGLAVLFLASCKLSSTLRTVSISSLMPLIPSSYFPCLKNDFTAPKACGNKTIRRALSRGLGQAKVPSFQGGDERFSAARFGHHAKCVHFLSIRERAKPLVDYRYKGHLVDTVRKFPTPVMPLLLRHNPSRSQD